MLNTRINISLGKKGVFFLFFCLSLSLMSCEEDDPGTTSGPDILDFIQNDPRFTTLSEAVAITNLEQTLQGRGPFTLFAPNNEAFEEFINEQGINSIYDLPDRDFSRILLNHILQEEKRAVDLINGYQSSLLLGGSSTNPISMYFSLGSGFAINSEANLGETDIEVENGRIHEVDAVIPLPKVTDHLIYNPSFNAFVEALLRPDISPELLEKLNGEGPFTIFAPTNDAFATYLSSNQIADINDIPSDTLETLIRYHIVEGRNVLSTNLDEMLTLETLANDALITIRFIENSGTIEDQQDRITNIIAGNIQGTNGVIHILDRVLLP